MKNLVPNCPLCLNQASLEYSKDKFRTYQICSNCGLIYVPRDQLVTAQVEKERYDTHKNDETDPLYHRYLSQIVDSILKNVIPGQRGLDFGCGRTKLLADIFKDKHFTVESYDLYYFPDVKIWHEKFDFIILSEVIEHLREPREEMMKLRSLLSTSGKIFVKTKLHPNEKADFDKWYYKRDYTHIQFFSPLSLEKMALDLSLGLPETIGEDLFCFTATSN